MIITKSRAASTNFIETARVAEARMLTWLAISGNSPRIAMSTCRGSGGTASIFVGNLPNELASRWTSVGEAGTVYLPMLPVSPA